MSNNTSTLKFIQKASLKHNNKYDYSKIIYINSKTKIEIVCPIHGSFWQVPACHCYGDGCPKCGTESTRQKRKDTKEIFIAKAKSVHGDKYNYDLVEYINSVTKVSIICHEHGVFQQVPADHIRSNRPVGCPYCVGLYKTIDMWIKEANEVHFGKYNYDKAVLLKANDKICITCLDHGDFWQSGGHHLQGHGCPECGKESVINYHKYDTAEFIKRANVVHDSLYNYSKVKYVNSDTIVCIICNEHGEFWQRPASHLSGQGCPYCNASIGEKIICKYLEKRQIKFKEQKTYKNLYSAISSRNRFKFDFYLPDYNLCIEYDGIQHFKPLSWSSDQSEKTKQRNLESIQARDAIKTNYCLSNGINLLRIPYWEQNNIHNIIDKFIMELQTK